LQYEPFHGLAVPSSCHIRNVYSDSDSFLIQGISSYLQSTGHWSKLLTFSNSYRRACWHQLLQHRSFISSLLSSTLTYSVKRSTVAPWAPWHIP